MSQLVSRPGVVRQERVQLRADDIRVARRLQFAKERGRQQNREMDSKTGTN